MGLIKEERHGFEKYVSKRLCSELYFEDWKRKKWQTPPNLLKVEKS